VTLKAAAGRKALLAAVRQALTRPYPVTAPMVVLVGLVPFYLVIARRARVGPVHAPSLALDQVFPLVPAWALVYGVLYAFLIVLPVLVVQPAELIRRTVRAYLTVWVVSYCVFLLYPTVAPRPSEVGGEGFAIWGLRFLYNSDPPYNCFPSLHVAHSFVSALAAYRVHRSLGLVAVACAGLVALSTLFTKQHYVADVVAGALLAFGAYAVFLRGSDRSAIPELDVRVAPALALCAGGIVGIGLITSWLAYRLGVGG